jgi:hypothetical protein
MIVCSFNVRGLGSRVKRNRIRDLVRDQRVEFLAIQETKMESIDEGLCRSLWGGNNCGCLFIPLVGSSGGILSLWNKDKFSFIFSFSGEGFLGVCLLIVAKQRVCYVVNVYAKCEIQARRRIWDNILISKRGFGGDVWCVVGDFNSFRAEEEMRGASDVSGVSYRAGISAFNDFIVGVELLEIPLFGRTFTWVHPNGVLMSKLDRFLLLDGWVEKWSNPMVGALHRDVSDHCPIVLRYNDDDWGPCPFWFKKIWLENSSFKDFVSKVWEEQNFPGWMGYILKERLKGLKEEIKMWNSEEYGAVDSKIQKLRMDI